MLEASTSTFNLFSELEPFATVLIAHATHVFFGGTPEVRRAKIRGRERGRGSWKRQWAPSPPARRAPTANTFRTY